jgi:hypothetical protein
MCADEGGALPTAILIVPGFDGRSNLGSQSVVKYIFQLAVGTDLQHGYIPEKAEALEDIILLIMHSRIAVFYTWARVNRRFRFRFIVVAQS